MAGVHSDDTGAVITSTTSTSRWRVRDPELEAEWERWHSRSLVRRLVDKLIRRKPPRSPMVWRTFDLP
jgi:hypothetical protein